MLGFEPLPKKWFKFTSIGWPGFKNHRPQAILDPCPLPVVEISEYLVDSVPFEREIAIFLRNQSKKGRLEAL